MSEADPLENLEWNEVILDDNAIHKEFMVALVAIKPDRTIKLIGTGFFISAHGDRATVATAAHCFEGIREILHPDAKHHLSALSEFLPPPSEIDLQSVKALYLKDNLVHTCPLEIAVWDSGTDFASFTISAPDNRSDLFKDIFMLSNDVPTVGDGVAMMGFLMKSKATPESSAEGHISLRPILRIGRDEEVFPERHFMLKGPALQTSIAVFSGMSGGLVARWPANEIKPFGFVSHAPEPQPTDPKLSGHSVASVFKVDITALGEKKQTVEVRLDNIGVGRDSSKADIVATFGFSEIKDQGSEP
jgi:hypothetical protein